MTEQNCYGDGTVFEGVRSKDSVVSTLELPDSLLKQIYEEVGGGKEWAIGGFASALEFAHIIEIEVSEKIRAQVKKECAMICEELAAEYDATLNYIGWNACMLAAKRICKDLGDIDE